MYDISMISDDIISLIFLYMPNFIKYSLSKTYFIEHCDSVMMNSTNTRYLSYIRDVIRSKRDFIFRQLIVRDYNIWNSYHLYKFQNSIYNNYTNFLLHYCIEVDSQKCRQSLLNEKNKSGNDDKKQNNNPLRKKRHKNVRIKHTTWRI